MTVKHKTPGKETLTPAHHVAYDEQASTLTAFAENDAPIASFTGGHAYVTNDAGQTIGIYNLIKK